jgi:hypothetical protein
MSQAGQEQDNGWAVEIVRQHFSLGLERICDQRFLRKRYQRFRDKQDPIYADLLAGMKDEPLAKTFVSYWTIAHTLATESRFWLENAIAQIIVHQARKLGRPVLEVYSQSMLSRGLLRDRRQIADIGEEELEHTTSRKPWRVPMQTNVLEHIDVLVGQQEREKVEERKPFTPRIWDETRNQEAIDKDRRQLGTIPGALLGPPASDVTLQCNLLVIEPHKVDGKPHTWACRFINRKTISSHPARKQERVNLLRLYALLVQEKIFRTPESLHVHVAELVPRTTGFEEQDKYPDYFSAETYWSSDQLWNFIGVPFEVVTHAIESVAKDFRDRLISGLRGLLPDADEWGLLPGFGQGGKPHGRR